MQQERQVGPAKLCLGVVEVTRQVTGYRRKEHYSEALLSEHDLALPPQIFRTVAVWWTVPEMSCAARVRACVCGEVVDALHAMEHACIGLLPLFAQCDRADIGGLSQDLHPDTGMATIFVYDGVPGGVGIAQIGYEQAEEWWKQTRALLSECPCAEGCPACIQSPKCGNGNQHLSKMARGAGHRCCWACPSRPMGGSPRRRRSAAPKGCWTICAGAWRARAPNRRPAARGAAGGAALSAGHRASGGDRQ